MKMERSMMQDLTYVSIWVRPMLVLNRLSLSLPCKSHHYLLHYSQLLSIPRSDVWKSHHISISNDNAITTIRCNLHNRKLFSWLHYSNVSFIQLPESDDNKEHFLRIFEKWKKSMILPVCRLEKISRQIPTKLAPVHKLLIWLISSPKTFWSDWFQALKLAGSDWFQAPKLSGQIGFKLWNFLARLVSSLETFKVYFENI